MSTTDTPKITARQFYLLVLEVIGEITGYRAGKAASRDEVIDAVLERSDFSVSQIEAVGAANPRKMKDGQINDAYADGLVYVKKRIGWAFRNQRAGTESGTTVYRKGPARTVQMGHKKWGLTDVGLDLAKSLKASREEEAARRAGATKDKPTDDSGVDSVTVSTPETTPEPEADAAPAGADQVTVDSVDDLLDAVVPA